MPKSGAGRLAGRCCKCPQQLLAVGSRPSPKGHSAQRRCWWKVVRPRSDHSFVAFYPQMSSELNVRLGGRACLGVGCALWWVGHDQAGPAGDGSLGSPGPGWSTAPARRIPLLPCLSVPDYSARELCSTGCFLLPWKLLTK